MNQGTKKKGKYIFFSLAGLIVILYFITQFWVNYRLDPFIDNLIKTGVINSSDSLYSIHYGKLTFNLTTRTLILKDVDLRANTELFAKRKTNGVHVPSGLLIIHLDELKLTGVRLYKAFVTKNLEAGNIIIDNPKLQYTLYDTIVRRDTLEKRPVNFDLYKLFSEKFHSLTVKNIMVTNAAFNLYKNATDTNATLSSTGIQIQVNKLKIDSAYSNNRYEINLARNIKITIAEAHWILPDSIYRIQFSNMELNATNESLRFEKIRVVPLVNKYKVAHIKGYADDLIQMTIDSLVLQQLNINLFLYNHSISCEHAKIEKFDLKAFRYKGLPRKNGYRALPLEQLKAAPLMVRIDSVTIKSGRVEYAEQIPGNNYPGTVFFSNISGSIFNISNDWAGLLKNNLCKISATGFFMGKGKLKMNATFNQASPDDAFTIEGTLGEMELSPLNPIILQAANVNLDKGTLDALVFKIAGTKKSASGNMTMLYHNLSVVMMKAEIGENGKKKKVEKKNIKSFLANTLVIVSENPKNNVTRHVTLFNKRDREKYIFNYIWQTILSGVKETVLSTQMKKGQEKLKELNPKAKELLK